jgi:hypothetical protein
VLDALIRGGEAHCLWPRRRALRRGCGCSEGEAATAGRQDTTWHLPPPAPTSTRDGLPLSANTPAQAPTPLPTPYTPSTAPSTLALAIQPARCAALHGPLPTAHGRPEPALSKPPSLVCARPLLLQSHHPSTFVNHPPTSRRPRTQLPRRPLSCESMAQGSRGPTPAAMPVNGAAVHDATPAAVNRKKQKRREKEAAKKAAQQQEQRQQQPQDAQQQLDEQPYDEGAYYSDDDYEHTYGPNGDYQQPYGHAPVRGSSGKKSRRKKKAPSAPPPLAYSQHLAARQSPAPNSLSHSHSMARSASKKDRIWNTSTAEERERIRDFWLSLGEDERKSLVKIEKEAVLRKMKEQQKHSCSCTVCGRKRTAIEEELEVLYDAYYEELEQYAHHQQDVASFIPEANIRYASSAPHPRPMLNPPQPHGPYDDDEEEYDSGEDDDEDSEYDSDISSEGDYSSGEPSLPPPEPSDFLQFGSSLQVKGMHTPVHTPLYLLGAC